jgi:hypothetical protein
VRAKQEKTGERISNSTKINNLVFIGWSLELILRLQIEGCHLSLQRCGVRIAEGLLKDF